MRTFGFNKLVRDGVIDGMERDGSVPTWRVLDDVEFKQELVKKLLEELREARASLYNPDEVVDVMEVEEWLSELGLEKATLELWQAFNQEVEEECMLDWDQLEEIRAEKQRRMGGFSYRAYVETVSVHEDNSWIPHYLTFPDLYPEIIGQSGQGERT